MFLAKIFKNYSFPKRQKQPKNNKNNASCTFDRITSLQEIMYTFIM